MALLEDHFEFLIGLLVPKLGLLQLELTLPHSLFRVFDLILKAELALRQLFEQIAVVYLKPTRLFHSYLLQPFGLVQLFLNEFYLFAEVPYGRLVFRH